MGHKNKHIPGKALPLDGKAKKEIPLQGSVGSYMQLNPSWRFCFACPELEYGKGVFFGFPAMLDDARLILEKLHAFDSLKWREILENGNALRSHHLVDVVKLADGPRKYIQEHQPGVDRIMSFRLGSTNRLFGKITDAGVFEVIMWDRDHKVFPMANQR